MSEHNSFLKVKFAIKCFLVIILYSSISNLNAGQIIRINPDLKHTLIGTSSVSVESPDSKHLVYVNFPKAPGSGYVGSTDATNGAEKCELWVCDYDLTNQRKVCVLPGVNKNHGGASQFWLNGCYKNPFSVRKIIFCSGHK